MQVYTVEDRAEMEIYVPSAKEACRFYDQFQSPHTDLKEKLEAAFSKVFNVLHGKDHFLCNLD